MSLEAKIEELNASVSRLIGTLQSVNLNLANPLVVVPATVEPKPLAAAEVAPVTKPVQTRKRVVQPEVKPEPAAAPADDGGFLDEPAAASAVEYTQDDVRAALVSFQKATNSQEKARKLLKEVGGADVLSALPKEKYAAVIEAASKR